MRRIFVSLISKISLSTSFILFIITISLTASLIRSISKINSATLRIKEAREKVEKEEEERLMLEARLELIKKDSSIEKQIRDKLGLAKEGEIVIVLPEDDILKRLAPEDIFEEEILPDPNWKKWAKLFGVYK